MNEEEIKEKIEFAKKIVEEYEEPYKTESFKIIFSTLMKTGKITKESPEDEDTEGKGFESSDKLEQKIGIPKSEIMNVVDCDGEKCELVNVYGKDNTEKLLNGSLIVLTVLRIKNNEEWVTAPKLGKILKEYGLITGEISRILQRNSSKSYVRTKGTGMALQYRITTEGIKKGIALIKDGV